MLKPADTAEMKRNMKIKTKLIATFIVTVLVCSAATLAVTYGGYNLVVADIAAGADSNNARVVAVRELKDLLYGQQKIISDSVVLLDSSRAEEFNKNSSGFKQKTDELYGQSQNSEKAELEKLKEVNGQLDGCFAGTISEGIKKADRAGFERLKADFEKQYGSLLEKEAELKKQVQIQADSGIKAVLSDSAALKELSGKQAAALENMLPLLESMSEENSNAAGENRESAAADRDLPAEEGMLREETANRKEPRGAGAMPAGAGADAGAGVPAGADAGTDAGSGAARQAAPGQSYGADSLPATGQTGADSPETPDYGKAAGEAQGYLNSALQLGADIRETVGGTAAETLDGALAKLALADAAVFNTQKAYAAAQAILSGSGEGGDGSGSSSDDGGSGEFAQLSKKAGEALGQLEKLLNARKNSELANAALKENDALGTKFNDLFAAKTNIEESGLADGYDEAAALCDQQLGILDKLEKAYTGYLAEDLEKSERLKNTLLITLAGIALLSLIIGMIVALLLSKNILRPIKKMTGLLEKAGKGDLTERLRDRRNDELGKLGDRVNDVLDGQQRMLEQVKTTSGDIGALRKGLSDLFLLSRENAGKVSGGIKKIMEGLITGVKHPAESLSGIETAGADTAGLAVTTEKAVADGLRALEIAASGRETVQEAGKVIRNATETVRQIADSISDLEDSSGKIGAITNTITEIASKTNLLALNAAIEAARAGQQGTGFTVLADEIRKLSDGSNKAAGEIKQLIKEIQDRIQVAVDRITEGIAGVDEGAGKIDSVRNSITEIDDAVDNIVQILRETANAIRERQDSTALLTGAIDTLAKAASDTAASGEAVDEGLELQKNTIRQMEEMTAKLDRVSDKLTDLLKQFRVQNV